jgi:hypothetical protein
MWTISRMVAAAELVYGEQKGYMYKNKEIKGLWRLKRGGGGFCCFFLFRGCARRVCKKNSSCSAFLLTALQKVKRAIRPLTLYYGRILQHTHYKLNIIHMIASMLQLHNNNMRDTHTPGAAVGLGAWLGARSGRAGRRARAPIHRILCIPSQQQQTRKQTSRCEVNPESSSTRCAKSKCAQVSVLVVVF